MLLNRSLLPVLAVSFALAGCGDGADDDMRTTDQEIITQPGTERVEIEVPTVDTMLIEREVDVDVDVDTTRIEGEVDVENLDAADVDLLQRR